MSRSEGWRGDRPRGGVLGRRCNRVNCAAWNMSGRDAVWEKNVITPRRRLSHVGGDGIGAVDGRDDDLRAEFGVDFGKISG